MAKCMRYATSYAETMILRVLEEKPDYFDDKPMDRFEFQAHLMNNLCVGASKYRAAVYKDTAANIVDDYYTKDKMRRLVNSGDKFHPYL